MTPEAFSERLATGGTVPLSAREWAALADGFPELERHDTRFAGLLLIVEVDGDLVAVEAPSREARVARRLGTLEEVRAFVDRRLGEYERMWDGCGVKVDYYGGS